MSDYRPITSSSTMLHNFDTMDAEASKVVPGAFDISFQNDGREAFQLTAFTGDAALAIELAALINGCLAKHGRLKGQIQAEAA